MTSSADDKLVDVAALQAALRQFAAERDWDQFHSDVPPSSVAGGIRVSG